MRKFFLFAALITLLLPVFSFSQVKVMSYNIRLDVESDGKDAWDNRKEDMVAYLNLIQPDFLGIQEGLPHQVQYIDKGLANYSYIGDGREGHGKGEYSAIYFDTLKWELIDSGMFWLSETPEKVSKGWDAACNRVCTFGIFENEMHQRIAVYNTHFDHVGQEARENSAKLILKKIEKNRKKLPLVLMGDFNIEPTNPVYETLANRLVDTGSRYAQFSDNAGTFNGFKLDGYAERRIDYIFINDALQIRSFQIVQPLTRKGRQVSDHFPVIAELKF